MNSLFAKWVRLAYKIRRKNGKDKSNCNVLTSISPNAGE